MVAALAFVLLAQSSTPTPVPSPTPAPTAAPFAVAPEFTGYGFYTNGSPGVDTETANALLNLYADAGKLRASATVGQYALPTVGFAIVPSNAPGANTHSTAHYPSPR